MSYGATVPLFLFESIKNMRNGKNRMAKHKPGAGKTHNLFDPSLHRGFVAMGLAIGTSGFLMGIRTKLQSKLRIPIQFLTIKTEGMFVMGAAIQCNHFSNGFEFSLQPSFCEIVFLPHRRSI